MTETTAAAGTLLERARAIREEFERDQAARAARAQAFRAEEILAAANRALDYTVGDPGSPAHAEWTMPVLHADGYYYTDAIHDGIAFRWTEGLNKGLAVSVGDCPACGTELWREVTDMVSIARAFDAGRPTECPRCMAEAAEDADDDGQPDDAESEPAAYGMSLLQLLGRAEHAAEDAYRNCEDSASISITHSLLILARHIVANRNGEVPF